MKIFNLIILRTHCHNRKDHGRAYHPPIHPWQTERQKQFFSTVFYSPFCLCISLHPNESITLLQTGKQSISENQVERIYCGSIDFLHQKRNCVSECLRFLRCLEGEICPYCSLNDVCRKKNQEISLLSPTLFCPVTISSSWCRSWVVTTSSTCISHLYRLNRSEYFTSMIQKHFHWLCVFGPVHAHAVLWLQ